MSTKYPGGFIKATAPVPTGGYNGSAPGIWTLEQAAWYQKNGMWPKPYDFGLWSWGYNPFGELGLGNRTNYSSPKQIGALTTWSTVIIRGAGAAEFSTAIKTDGTLWSWGYNAQGQLGLGNTTYYSSPKQVGALTTWSKIAVGIGSSFALAIKTDGTLWSWGDNGYGSLGLGIAGGSRSSPTQVGALTTWSSVASGRGQTLSIKTDGTLWGWGLNDDGQLGLGNTTNTTSPNQIGALTTWSKVVCGSQHTIAIKTDGTLWSWGRNASGQLGLGNRTFYSSPKQVGALTTWLNVAGGQYFTVSIKTDGTLWSWGQNNNGQLGLGNTTYYSSPKQVGALTTWSKVACGEAFTVAIKTDGTLWGWGYNGLGGLGLNNVTTYSSPKQVGALTTWYTISCGTYSTIALKGS